VVRKVTANVLGLAEVVGFGTQMINIVQMFNRITNVHISTNATILANPCYMPLWVHSSKISK
jgi:hypothetical protein